MSATQGSSRRITEPRRKRSDANRKTKPVSVRRSSKNSVAGDLPVMARTSTFGVSPQLTKPRRKVKRRFDVLVNSRGAEMRLPALPQLSLDWRLLSLILAIVLMYALYQVLTLPVFQVEGAQISGLEHVSPAQIEETLNLSEKLVFTLNPEEIEATLLSAFPEFSQVDVTVDIPNTVAITVTERTPVLIWRMAGKSNLVDADGMPFSLRENFPVIDLPVVHAEEFVTTQAEPELTEEEPSIWERWFGQVSPELLVKPGVQALISPRMVDAVLELSKVAPLGSNLIYTTKHGLGWKDQGGWFVYLGKDEEISMKYAVYEALWEQLKGEGLQPAFISVEHVHAPYYRLEEE
ncbi:MAG TPA: FtsQ-type POTRA domain-containing protein [Anaerolineales bacterium]|nr:FtsQ-type POTRA domain-containing protein [Anaerolineales bacterium]